MMHFNKVQRISSTFLRRQTTAAAERGLLQNFHCFLRVRDWPLLARQERGLFGHSLNLVISSLLTFHSIPLRSLRSLVMNCSPFSDHSSQARTHSFLSLVPSSSSRTSSSHENFFLTCFTFGAILSKSQIGMEWMELKWSPNKVHES